MKKRYLGFAAVAFGVLVGFNVQGSGPAAAVRTVHVFGTYPESSAEDLVASADAVAVITPVGRPNVHWNARDNRPWGDSKLGLESHIYSDQQVRVARAVRGQLPQGGFILRGVGGTLSGIELRYEDAAAFQDGREYVALLERVMTPTKEGAEPAWALVRHRHGLFSRSSDGTWVNAIGKELPLDALEGTP